MKNRFPTLYNCSSNKDGKFLEYYSSSGWQLNFRREFNDKRMEDVGQLLQLVGTTVVEEDKEDFMVWTTSY